MLWLWIALGVLAILVVLVVVGYNRLVRLRNEADTGWANIDVQLQRRADLIPNLVEAVRGYAAHERGVFEEVTKARSALQQAGTPAAAGEANELLTAALGRLFAVAEAYPELRASENFLRLQDELTDTEDKISAARRYYNTTVMHYNTGIQSLPWVLVARPLGFREKEFFAAEGDVAVPQVVVHAADVTLQQQIRRNRLQERHRARRLRAAAGRPRRPHRRRARPQARRGSRSIGSGLYAIFAIVSSRRMVARMTGAQEIGPEQLRPLRRLVENVSIAAGLPVTPGDPDRRRPRTECVRRRDPAADELRRGDDRPAAHDAEARARGRARSRDLARAEPRHVPHDHGDDLRRRHRADRGHRIPHARSTAAAAHGAAGRDRDRARGRRPPARSVRRACSSS